MIPVLEIAPDVFEPITGNPILMSLEENVDDRRRAPLAVILHESWTDQERAEFGVFLVEEAPAPDGHRVLSTGYERQGGQVIQVHELEPIPLEELKAAKWEQAKAKRDALENGNAPTPFGPAQCDDKSKLKISGLVQMATIAAANSQPFEEEFTLADNSIVVLDGPMAVAMGIAVGSHVSAIHAVARSLRTAIEACETAGQLDAVDIEAAPWP